MACPLVVRQLLMLTGTLSIFEVKKVPLLCPKHNKHILSWWSIAGYSKTVCVIY
jgi:hypothetical protein